ncbi:MAG: protein translocase subunit SecF [Gammaproteobacteria bacterium]
MEFFKQNTKIDFMGISKWAAVFSAVIFVWSIVGLFLYGLNFGLDFTGGLQVEATYQESVDLTKLRAQLTNAGFEDAVVQSYGTSEDVSITLRDTGKVKQDTIVTKLITALPGAHIQNVDFVGPQIGKELATYGALALVISLILIMIYIAIRFEYRFAVSAALALIHDPVLILGVFAWFHVEFNLPALAGVLAVIGYSLNDTIVIFDRVRENFRKLRKDSPREILNISINQTLSRTVMTSGLTLIAVFSLFFLGGEMIHSFSLAMIIGILIGTYSSIYVAGSLALTMGLNRKDFLPTPKKELDDRP